MIHLPSAELIRLLRFLLVGVLNTAVGYALFAGLIWLGAGPQLALPISFGLGVLWNYATHARLVFTDARRDRLLAYIATYVGLYALNALLLWVLMALGLSALVAQALCLPVSAALAFLAIGRVLTGRWPWSPTASPTSPHP